MFPRQLISIVLLIAFLGALTLVIRPDLHMKTHDHAHEQAHHDEEEACAVCHVLGHFILEGPFVQAVRLERPDFPQQFPAVFVKPFLTQPSYALTPRAPPLR